ncbi:MAG: hypothetical protein AB1481_04485, partial [Candidatus Omnitrophota bacterium]
VEYQYDGASQTLTRTYTDNSTGQVTTMVFQNIIEAPFYTEHVDFGGIENHFIESELSGLEATLIIVLTGQRLVRGNLPISFSLGTRLRIRN